jgi:hypothetical protein
MHLPVAYRGHGAGVQSAEASIYAEIKKKTIKRISMNNF